ncbi:hypothetical protein [Nocardioides montaniterrae]
MDVEGVAEMFRGELDLLSALQLKWHTRLGGHVERQLMTQPMDLQTRVMLGWKAAADELPGVRLIIDHYTANPVDEEMAKALTKAVAKEHHYLAVMAGRASLDSLRADDERSEQIGAEIEAGARDLHRGVSAVILPQEEVEPRGSLLERLRAVIAA